MDEKFFYAVVNSGGSWEDKWDHIVGIFEDEKLAIKIAEDNWEEYGNWEEHMEVPPRLFDQHIEYFEDLERPDVYETVIPFHDHAGYTKEQWEQSYQLYYDNRVVDVWDYYFTKVIRYPANKLINLSESKDVWIKYKTPSYIELDEIEGIVDDEL
jgi:hypothetical protein